MLQFIWGKLSQWPAIKQPSMGFSTEFKEDIMKYSKHAIYSAG